MSVIIVFALLLSQGLSLSLGSARLAGQWAPGIPQHWSDRHTLPRFFVGARDLTGPHACPLPTESSPQNPLHLFFLLACCLSHLPIF